MATYWCSRHIKAGMGPLKVQAHAIKNIGKHPIYIFNIEDDVIITNPAQLQAFSMTSIQPGMEMNLVTHPYFPKPNISGPDDLDLCIHSDEDIEVGIFSSDDCERWTTDPTHPWNGAALPNGQYTRWFQPQMQKPMGVPPGNLGMPVGSGGSGGSPLPAGNPGYMAGALPWKQQSVIVKMDGSLQHIPINITVTIECSCSSLDLFRKGCTCGAVQKKKWGLQ